VTRRDAAGQGSEAHGGRRFDAFELVARHGVVAGSFDAQAAVRLADRLASGPARIAYRIGGTVDALGHPALTVELEGSVPLACQRCLEPFEHPVALRTLVLLARDETELARLDEGDEHEVVLADSPLDPVALAEDELLLSLPYVPRHADGECPAGAEAGAAEQTPARSPFDALAALKAPSGSPKSKA
jgi:uncharacterized protein